MEKSCKKLGVHGGSHGGFMGDIINFNGISWTYHRISNKWDINRDIIGILMMIQMGIKGTELT